MRRLPDSCLECRLPTIEGLKRCSFHGLLHLRRTGRPWSEELENEYQVAKAWWKVAVKEERERQRRDTIEHVILEVESLEL